jgi:1,4-alpha-glucan branching enzyme
MSIKKQVMKSKPVCKVSFKISKKDAEGAKQANLAGDFNKWSETSHPFKALKDGSFSLTINLETGKNYQFRYLLDGNKWINDNEADNFVPGGIGAEENSVLSV